MRSITDTSLIGVYTNTSRGHGRRPRTLNPITMLEKALDDCGFEHWKRVSEEFEYRTFSGSHFFLFSGDVASNI